MRADCGRDKDGKKAQIATAGSGQRRHYRRRLGRGWHALYGLAALPREIFRHQIYRFAGPENLPIQRDSRPALTEPYTVASRLVAANYWWHRGHRIERQCTDRRFGGVRNYCVGPW